MFTLAVYCLTTFTLPWFMDLPFQVRMQYCSLQHRTLLPLPVISTTGLFLLWLHPFILSEVSSPLISCSILSTYWPGEFIFQCPIFLSFHTVHGLLKARILKWFAFLQWTTLSELSTITCPSWVALQGMTHSFIELDKAVVHVISLVSFLWLWFSLCLASDE